MKAVFFEGARKVSVKSLPAPKPVDGQVLVRIESAAICGSDMAQYHAAAPDSRLEGHENAGVVVESRTDRWREGDRVVLYAVSGCGACEACVAGDRIFCAKQGFVLGGFGEYVAVDAENCLRLPDGLSFDAGAIFGDCVGLAYNTFTRLGAAAGARILIVGLGPVGLGMILMGKVFKAGLIGVDPSARRREIAATLGCDNVLDPSASDLTREVMKLTGGWGPDFAMDCAGRETTQLACMRLCRKGGKVALVAGNAQLTMNPNELFLAKELTVMGNWYFNFKEFNTILAAIKGVINPDVLVSHHFKRDSAQEAFELFASGNCGKVVFTP